MPWAHVDLSSATRSGGLAHIVPTDITGFGARFALQLLLDAGHAAAAAVERHERCTPLRRPDDWHLHLRDGAALRAVLPHHRRAASRAPS